MFRWRRIAGKDKGRISRHATFVIKHVEKVDGVYVVSVVAGIKGREEDWDYNVIRLVVGNSIEVELTARIELLTLEDYEG